MYTKDEINDFYERIVKTIDISNELFDIAEDEYNAMGKWIDKETPDYSISIYPQGSFALGTVIKPIDDKDDYDVDLVCEFIENYGLDAKELRIDVVKPLLQHYKKSSGIEEKRRCLHVDYEDTDNFHLDIIPSVYREVAEDKIYSLITSKNDDKSYEYIGSNPRGYTNWFNEQKENYRNKLLADYIERNSDIIKYQADVEEIKEYHLKTPLQKAIQILKRHRDIMFKDKDRKLKPISIIITTIAADLYKDEDNIYDTLHNILTNAEDYIEEHKKDGEYRIDNPSYTGNYVENFADKWKDKPERKVKFFNWLKKAKADLIGDGILSYNRVEFAQHIKSSIGDSTGNRVFSEIANEQRKAIEKNELKLDTKTGAIEATGTKEIPRSHHHGK